MNDQSKTNSPLTSAAHFQNKSGSQHLRKNAIIKDNVAVIDIKTEDLVRKNY